MSSDDEKKRKRDDEEVQEESAAAAAPIAESAPSEEAGVIVPPVAAATAEAECAAEISAALSNNNNSSSSSSSPVAGAEDERKKEPSGRNSSEPRPISSSSGRNSGSPMVPEWVNDPSSTYISKEEMSTFREFFCGRPVKTPEKYISIRRFILEQWLKVKPTYLKRSMITSQLRGDVNSIGHVYAYLEKRGYINVDATTSPPPNKRPNSGGGSGRNSSANSSSKASLRAISPAAQVGESHQPVSVSAAANEGGRTSPNGEGNGANDENGHGDRMEDDDGNNNGNNGNDNGNENNHNGVDDSNMMDGDNDADAKPQEKRNSKAAKDKEHHHHHHHNTSAASTARAIKRKRNAMRQEAMAAKEAEGQNKDAYTGGYLSLVVPPNKREAQLRILEILRQRHAKRKPPQSNASQEKKQQAAAAKAQEAALQPDDGCSVRIWSWEHASLRRYRRHFQLQIDANASRQQLAAAVREHFKTMPMPKDDQVVSSFVRFVNKKQQQQK